VAESRSVGGGWGWGADVSSSDASILALANLTCERCSEGVACLSNG
jgi:hypothetical protein